MHPLVLLMLAIAFEVAGSTALRLSDGMKHIGWGAFAIASFVAALALLSVSMRAIPLGISYATWAGVGTVGAVLMGMALFGERLAFLQVVAVGIVIAGVLLLHLGAPSAPPPPAP